MYNWKDITDNQAEHRFYKDGKPIFKQFKSILKFHAPGLAPVEDESGWYHIDASGNALYKKRYKRTFGFYCNRAAVTDLNNLCYHINEQGNRVYETSYAWVGNFQEDICTVRTYDPKTNRNFYFHIGLDGGNLYTKQYLYAGDFRDGIAVVRDLNGLCHHIDRKGQRINNKEFLDLGIFHKNIAPARDEKGWFHSDVNGNPLYEKRFTAIEPFYNGFALVETLNGDRQVIAENGEIILCI